MPNECDNEELFVQHARMDQRKALVSIAGSWYTVSIQKEG